MTSEKNSAGHIDTSGREIALIDFLIVLAKYKKLIFAVPFIVAIVAAGVSLILPSTYRANTKLLPPQQSQSGAAALLSQLGGIAGAAAGVAGIKNPNDLYVGMLKSRTIADKLIGQFKLGDVYETKSIHDARIALEANTFINSGKDGLITIEVDGKDPVLTAAIANGYVDELIKLTRTIAVTEASHRRIFFERQLELSKDNLAASEGQLKHALDTQGVISVDAASRALIETVGRLRAQVSAKEIQLGSMRAVLTVNNPEYKRTQHELNSLRDELSRLENGRSSSALAVKRTETPEGLANIKILRDVKYHQMLYEMLAKQYEVARLDEAKEGSMLQVLDPAIPPERRFKPKRAVIVMLSTTFAFIFAVLIAFFVEARRRAMVIPDSARKLEELRTHFLAR